MIRGLLYFVMGAALIGASLLLDQPDFPRWLPAVIGLPTMIAGLVLGAEALGSTPSPVHLGMFPLGVLMACLAVNIHQQAVSGIRVFSLFTAAYLLSLGVVLIQQFLERRAWVKQHKSLRFGDNTHGELGGVTETL